MFSYDINYYYILYFYIIVIIIKILQFSYIQIYEINNDE